MKRYNSKIGIGIALFISIILVCVSIIMILNRIWIGLLLISLVSGFVIYIFMATYYIISDNDLVVKCGFLYKTTIKIDRIKKLVETNNPLSSPATSLDRIAIHSYNNFILVSPKDKMDFINHLKTINPRIEVILKNKK